MKPAKAFAQKDEKMIYRDGITVQTEIRLPFVDRIRILFGSKLHFDTDIATQWRCGQFDSNSTVGIEKISTRLKQFFSK